MESLLLLSAEMDDGLGLLVTTRPHGKTAGQLLERAISNNNATSTMQTLWQCAAENGHVHMLQWLCDNVSLIYYSQQAVRYAAQGGHLEALKWFRLNAHFGYDY